MCWHQVHVLTRQALGGRISNLEVLRRQIRTWQTLRNHCATTIDWRYTTEDTRFNLKKRYPTIHVSLSTSQRGFVSEFNYLLKCTTLHDQVADSAC
jgi:hypothetical protein